MKSLSALLLSAFAALSPATAQNPQPFDPDDWSDVLARNVTRADVNHFTQTGIDVQSVENGNAMLYLSTSQIAQLRAQGYDLVQLPRAGMDAGTDYTAYHTYATLTTDLQAIAAAHPSICRLYSIGTSTQGRNLWFLKISDNPDVQEDEPEFKYVSSMHGDEVVGIELCMNLADLITSSYGTDPQITALVDNVEIWIMPMMNPDGTNAHTRYNAGGYDLNRSFPDRVTNPTNTTTGRPIEVQHMMNWEFVHSPVLAANFHGGSRVVNFPYDSDPNPNVTYSASPDDDLFTAQSLTYSQLNLPMYNSTSFVHGITNGVAWYTAYGGMQDWSYVWQGCNEVTIELYNTKWPAYSTIATLWNDNRAAMLTYMGLCLKGVRGLVTDLRTGSPLAATVQVVGRNHDVFTDPDVGDYHRMLLPGTYSLVVSAPGYVSRTIPGIVIGTGDATRVDVALSPIGFHPPVADIRVNGLDGPITTTSATNNLFTLSLAANDLAWAPHDYWLRVTWNQATLWWNWPGIYYGTPTPAFFGGLLTFTDLPFAYGALPPGNYTFTFAVDSPDGLYQGTYSDSISLTVN